MIAPTAYSSVERGTLVGKSLIKTEKRIGPKCEPCGTPADIGCLGEMALVHSNSNGPRWEVSWKPRDTWQRNASCSCCQFIEQVRVPHFVKSVKSLSKNHKDLRSWCSVSVPRSHCSTMKTSCMVVDCSGRKPNWSLLMISCFCKNERKLLHWMA